MSPQVSKRYFSAGYLASPCVTTPTAVSTNSFLIDTNIILGTGFSFASPIDLSAGQDAQWSNVIPTRDLSEWQKNAIKRLEEIVLLPTNWDSYGSPPVTQAAAAVARKILTENDIESFVAPRVVPVSGGGLQLEWSIRNRGLEIEILDDGSIEYLKLEENEPCKEGRIQKQDEVSSFFLWLLSGPVQLAA